METKKKIPYNSPKFYFVYFLLFSIVILIIFSFIIVGYYWDYWSQIRTMDKYYRGQQDELTQVFPEINQYDPIKGQPDAKVIIFEYSDFLCPNCQAAQADLTSLEKTYGDRLLFVFKGLPITNEVEARPALLAAYCANEQSKFWEYKDLLFQNPDLLNQQLYRQYAAQLNLNLEQFNQCFANNKYTQIIDRNLAEALTLQINSVPTVFINGQKIEGYSNFKSLKNVIAQKLK